MDTSLNFHDVKRVTVERFYRMKECTTPTWVLSLSVKGDGYSSLNLFINNENALYELVDSLGVITQEYLES